MEELQLIFEMLFPDHIGQLRPLYNSLKLAHDENTKFQVYVLQHLKVENCMRLCKLTITKLCFYDCRWDETFEKTLVIEREIAKDRPPTWSEMTLEKEIELLKQKGLEGDEECKKKKKRLEYEKQELDDSIYKGFEKNPHSSPVV